MFVINKTLVYAEKKIENIGKIFMSPITKEDKILNSSICTYTASFFLSNPYP